MATGNLGSRFSVKHSAGFAVKIVAIAVFVWLTNTGFIQRIDLLIGQGRWVTLVGFVGVWGLSLMALLAAAFQGSRWLRFSWAAVISLTTAVGFAYHKASGSEFGVLDALSLWNARNEAARAAEFYTADLYWLAAVMVAGFIVFAMPPAAVAGWPRRWLTRLAWLPALPGRNDRGDRHDQTGRWLRGTADPVRAAVRRPGDGLKGDRQPAAATTGGVIAPARPLRDGGQRSGEAGADPPYRPAGRRKCARGLHRLDTGQSLYPLAGAAEGQDR